MSKDDESLLMCRCSHTVLLE